MATKPKASSMLFGLGGAAMAGLIAALLARNETREKVLERGTKSLAYLKEQGQKLRESSQQAVKKGSNLIGCQCRESAASSAEGERQAYEEAKREGMGG